MVARMRALDRAIVPRPNWFIALNRDLWSMQNDPDLVDSVEALSECAKMGAREYFALDDS